MCVPREHEQKGGPWGECTVRVKRIELLKVAEEYVQMMLGNSQFAIRSAKETILEMIGRLLDDALCLETINAYSSPGDFKEVQERLARFYGKSREK